MRNESIGCWSSRSSDFRWKVVASRMTDLLSSHSSYISGKPLLIVVMRGSAAQCPIISAVQMAGDASSWRYARTVSNSRWILSYEAVFKDPRAPKSLINLTTGCKLLFFLHRSMPRNTRADDALSKGLPAGQQRRRHLFTVQHFSQRLSALGFTSRLELKTIIASSVVFHKQIIIMRSCGHLLKKIGIFLWDLDEARW